MSKQKTANQRVKVWINSIIGAVPAVIVRDLTGDNLVAAQANAMEGESVFEVRFTAGPHRGSYTNCPARDLRAA